MAKLNEARNRRPEPLPPAEALGLARDALILDLDYSPLEQVLPDQSSLAARFDACLIKREGNEILVKAFLVDRGQGSEELRLSAEVFREALKSLPLPDRWGRVLAELVFVAPQKVSEERWQGLAGAAEGKFLSPVLVSRSCLELDPLNFRRQSRVKVTPPPPWYLKVLQKRSSLGSEELETILRQRRETDQQARRLIFSGTPWATYTLIGVNVLAFGLWLRQTEMLMQDPRFAGFNAQQMDLARMVAESEALKMLGANGRDLVLGQSQWWRLLACMFLHFGFLHLAVNMISLYSLGSLLERLGGRRRFLLLYFVTGLCGSGLGLLNPSGFPSVGASGAILGLAGALMALRWRRPREIPKTVAGQVFRSLLKPTLVIFGLGLALQVAFWMGIRTPLLDNYAHLGGLASGLGLSLLFPLTAVPHSSHRS
jgi:membrane associated rhomboid family serine protease